MSNIGLIMNYEDFQPLANAAKILGNLQDSEKINFSEVTSIVQQAAENKETGDIPVLDNPGKAGDLLEGKQLLDGNLNVITGTIPNRSSSDLTTSGATVIVPSGYYASQATKSVATATQATPSISVNSSGLITASATQSTGYISAGTKSSTKQLNTQAAQTIIPSTSDKIITSGTYLTGTQTIRGDANLVAANIAQGISIFGVTGSLSSNSNTNDATATADDIVLGETAYVKGVKLTGTNPYEKVATDASVSSQANLITQIKSVLQNAATNGVELPLLTNPASQSDVLFGKEFIDENGNKVTGTSIVSGGTVETGILTGSSTMTSRIAMPTETIYYNLEDIPNFSSKKLIVLFQDNSYNMMWTIILSRSNISDDFTISYNFHYGNIETYILTFTNNIISIESDSYSYELRYFAM